MVDKLKASIIGTGRDLGMDTVGFLMMAHMIDEEAFLKQAFLMES